MRCMYEYENLYRVCYGDEEEKAVFIPVCPQCGRFVKRDKTITFKDAQNGTPNAECKKCGRVAMPFEGFV